MITQNHSEKDQNQQVLAKIPKEKKIKKILKKIPYCLSVPKLICIQNYFQISESAIINEASLRDPENCTESILTNTFYFKRIGSLKISDNVLELNLKDIISPKLPINYFIQRYRSFGDRELHNMSLMFQKIVEQFGYLGNKQRALSSLPGKEYFQNIMSNYLETVKDKNFIMFFYEPSNLGLSLKKFIFSKKLLEMVGLDIEEIRDDYIKHKHIFFEIFGCDVYKEIIIYGTTLMSQIMQETRLGKISLQQSLQKVNLSMKTLIHKRKKVDGNIFEQEIPATVKLYKPTFFLTMIEITDLNQQKVMKTYPLAKNKVQIISQQKLTIQSCYEDRMSSTMLT